MSREEALPKQLFWYSWKFRCTNSWHFSFFPESFWIEKVGGINPYAISVQNEPNFFPAASTPGTPPAQMGEVSCCCSFSFLKGAWV
jgi:hypothetical protein